MAVRSLDISVLYELHRDSLLYFFVRRTADPDTALDLWSETFAEATLAAPRFRGRSDEEAAGWLFGIARNLLARYYRQGQAETRAMRRLGIERPELSPDLQEEIVRRSGLRQLRRDLAVAADDLSVELRSAVMLRVVDELPYPEVAARLAISEPAARARVSRGLRALHAALDPERVNEAMST